MMRFERLRFYSSGLAAVVFYFYIFHALERIFNRWGIITRVYYSSPKKKWTYIGDNWYFDEVTDDFTRVVVFLFVPALVLSYYFARLLYFLDLKRVFSTWCDVGLASGWIVGPGVLIAEQARLANLSYEWGLLERWPNATGWAILGILVVSVRLIVDGWTAMLRNCARSSAK